MTPASHGFILSKNRAMRGSGTAARPANPTSAAMVLLAKERAKQPPVASLHICDTAVAVGSHSFSFAGAEGGSGAKFNCMLGDI